MFVYRLTLPVDDFDGLTALPDWLRYASPQAVAWHLCALLALADAAAQVGWRGDLRHLPSIGRIGPNPYLVVKQDDNGATFVVSETQLPWDDEMIAICTRISARSIGSWTHPTAQDMAEAMAATMVSSRGPDRLGEPPF
jgi:hypothetical protein